MQHDLTPIAQTLNWTQQADDCVSQTQSRSAIWHLCHYKHLPYFEPSRAYGHYNGRVEGKRDVRKDTTMGARDWLNAAKKHGVCRESLYKYEKSHLYDQGFWIFKKGIKAPPASAYADGERHKVTAYASLLDVGAGRRYDTDNYIKALDHGHIFGMGIVLHFYGLKWDSQGAIIAPEKEVNPVGYPEHALTIIGYTDNKEFLWAWNSKGPKWGPFGNGLVLLRMKGYADRPDCVYDCFVIQDMTS